MLGEVLTRLQNTISTDEMRRLNYEVDGKKRNQAEVCESGSRGKAYEPEDSFVVQGADTKPAPGRH